MRRVFCSVRDPAPPGEPAIQSGRAVSSRAGSDLQHGGQLHHQHQLAELRRREHASYLTQMLGLTTQNFVSAATGIVLADCAHSRFCAHSVKTVGNFWVDLTRSHALRAHAHLRPRGTHSRLAGHAADIWAPMSMRRRSKAPSKRCSRGRSHRRSRSRCSAPMVAASSTPTRRFLMRIRPHQQLPPMLYILLISASLTQRVRPHGRQPTPGLGDPCCDGRPVHRRRVRLPTGRRHMATRHRQCDWASPAATWKARKSVSVS